MKNKCKRVLLTVILVLACFVIIGPALAGQLTIKGSTSVLPVAQKIAEACLEEKNVSAALSGGGSGNGIKALIDGTTDIATASRFISNDEVKLACSKGVYPVPFRIAADCIVPVVHPSNPVSDLTLKQLAAIYKGEVANWKDVGGQDEKIVVVSRDGSSGTCEIWDKILLRDDGAVPGALSVASNGAVVQTISKTNGAIGYISLAYLNDTIKQLMVGGVMGSEAAMQSGQYVFTRPLYMFTNGWPEGKILYFIDYALSARGQALVRSAGSITVVTP